MIDREVRALVASDPFADIWVRVNIRAQQALMRVLEGDETVAVSVQGDQVVLDVSDVIAQVQQRLVARGLTIVENVPIPRWTSTGSKRLCQRSGKNRLPRPASAISAAAGYLLLEVYVADALIASKLDRWAAERDLVSLDVAARRVNLADEVGGSYRPSDRIGQIVEGT